MTTPETARELLWRHGLPEDVLDGALALHAQELAAVQRRAHDEARPHFHMGLPCMPCFGCHVAELIALIEPGASAPLPVPSSRASALAEAADIAESLRQFEPAFGARKSAQVSENVGILRVATELRRLAAEAPLSPFYEHPECGFHWHGRDGMDIPMRDGQPVCPRCELAKTQKQLRHTGKLREEVGAECKRRGKRVLEQSEQILALERTLDDVRQQLGAEILRTGQAEAELRRLAAEAHDGDTQDDGPDTFPAWLAQRFDPQGAPWDGMSDDDRAYWEHQAAAVRRAVERGGFKDAEALDANPLAACVCPHPVDEHSVYGCADGCACEYLPRRPAAPAVPLVGSAAPAGDEATARREPDPDCERCDGSGLDPDAYFVNHDTQTWTHAPCSECLPEDDDDPVSTKQRVKHTGPDTDFCVLCLSGEHERVDEEAPRG